MVGRSTSRIIAIAMLASVILGESMSIAIAQDRSPIVDVARDWLGLAALLISVGGVVFAWLTAGSSKNAEALASHENRLNQHAERLSALENDMKHLPAKDDVNDLKLAIAELKGTIGRLDEHLSGISGTVRRMDDFLRQSDR